jgi:hypothetical protein
LRHFSGFSAAKRAKRTLAVSLLLGISLFSLPAMAQDNAALEQRLKDIEDQLKAQKQLLDAQGAVIAQQQKVLSGLGRVQQIPAATTWSGFQRPVVTTTEGTQIAQADTPNTPVGQAPEQSEEPPQVIQSLPEGLAVLTPTGQFVLTPSVEYTHTANDRLVYRGVVIVPGINLGAVEASSDSRSIAVMAADVRYGLFDGFELEARIPYTWSDDRATVLSQGPSGSATQSLYLQDSGLGDIEFGARYQINRGLDDWPIFVANAKIKLDNGMGPYDIKRDSAGIAQQIALGSGFMAVQGGVSFLKVSDPAVLFGSLTYVYQVAKDINQNIGGVFVGGVDPSSSIGMNLGFGFAVNPEFSFSFGYSHSYVLPQYTVLGGTQQHTNSIQVGSLTLGIAYRLSPKLSLNTNFEFGVTADAPDMRAVFSFPLTF